MTKTLHPAITVETSEHGYTTYHVGGLYLFDFNTVAKFNDGALFEGCFNVEHSCPGWSFWTDQLEVAEFVAQTYDSWTTE